LVTVVVVPVGWLVPHVVTLLLVNTLQVVYRCCGWTWVVGCGWFIRVGCLTHVGVVTLPRYPGRCYTGCLPQVYVYAHTTRWLYSCWFGWLLVTRCPVVRLVRWLPTLAPGSLTVGCNAVVTAVGLVGLAFGCSGWLLDAVVYGWLPVGWLQLVGCYVYV